MQQRYVLPITSLFFLILCVLSISIQDVAAISPTTNTPPHIIEGEQLELVLHEDNTQAENLQQPKPYILILTATDKQYDKLWWTIRKKPHHGTVSIKGSNNVQTVSYTPNPHFHGTDRFTVQVADMFDEVDAIEIVVFIHPINDAPYVLRSKKIQVPYGSPIQSYPLTQYFKDIDNEHHELTFEVNNNSKPDVVFARINQQHFLELAYKNSGVSTVTVKASDPHGAYAETYFHITVTPVKSTIQLLRTFPPLTQPNQKVVVFFQVSSLLGVNPTGLVTVTNGVQSCHYKLTINDGGFGRCNMALPEYRDYTFQAEYTGDNNFQPSTTQQNFMHPVRPKVLLYHTKPRAQYEFSEDGMSDSYAVSLSQPPVAPVELTVIPDAQFSINEADVGQAVTFTLEDTQDRAELILIPADDTVAEGQHYGKITHKTSSLDKAYHQLSSTLAFPIQDNDPGIVIRQTDGVSRLVEEDTADNYLVSLSTLPQQPVNVHITSYDNQVIAYPNNLLFSAETWNTVQNVQISAVPDTELEDEHSAVLVHTVRTQDVLYASEQLLFNIDGENTNVIDVMIQDNDIEQQPAPPEKLKAHLLPDTQVLLKWQDNSDNETHFVLKRNGSQLSDVIAENSQSYRDLEVRCDTDYRYELFSVNKKGFSEFPATILTKTLPCTTLTAPTHLVAFLVARKYVNLVWNDTNNSEAGYLIKRNGQYLAQTSAHTVGYRDSQLACSMNYEYDVSAIGFDNKISPPTHVTIRTAPCSGKFQLTLKIKGKGAINGCTQECTQIYPEKQALSFQIRSETGWIFSRWAEGDCASPPLIMDEDKTCIAYFKKIEAKTDY